MDKTLVKIKPSKPRKRPVGSNALTTKPTMLLVLGVHRSGTSVVARSLECLGGENSKNQQDPHPVNPKGFFEDRDVELFNENHLLPKLDSGWHHTNFIDWSALSNPERSSLGLQALSIIRKNYDKKNSLSILKEPRIAQLLPFWLGILNHAGYNIKVVCAVRDPLSVSHSLQKRDGFSVTKAGMLYLTTWLSILKNIQELPVAFVHFDDLFKNAHKSLSSLADTLGIPLPQDFDERVNQFGSQFLDTSLRHQNYQEEDLSLASDLPPLSIQLYRYLSAACNSQNIKKATKFILSSESAIRELRPLLTEYDHLYQDQHQKSSKIARLTEESHARANHITHLEQVAGERGAEIERLNGEIVRLNEEAGVKTSQLAHLEQIAAERSSEIERLNGDIIGVQEVSETRHGHIEHLKKERTEHEAEIERLNGEILRLNEEAGAKTSQVAHLEQVGSERGAEIERLNREILRLNEEAGAKTTQLAHLEQIAAERGAEIERLKEDINRLNEVEKVAEERIKEIECLIEKRNNELEILCRVEKEREELREKSRGKEKIISEIFKRNEEYKTLLDNKKREIENIRRSIIGIKVDNILERGEYNSEHHSHKEFSIKYWDDFYSKDVNVVFRICVHNNQHGIIIFDDPSNHPLFLWEPNGVENETEFCAFIFNEIETQNKLEKMTTRDLNILRSMIRCVLLEYNGRKFNDVGKIKWMIVAEACVQELLYRNDRLHYDDIKAKELVGELTGYSVKIINPEYKNKRMDNIIVEFFVINKDLKINITYEGDSPPLYGWATNYKNHLKLTALDKEIIEKIKKEVPNLVYHIKNQIGENKKNLLINILNKSKQNWAL
jgi:peptidoglycan hydrolase CwlO-like protein